MFYNGSGMNGYDWGWSLFMGIFWLIILAFVIYVVVRMLKHYEIGSGNDNSKNDPLEIVKQRYAKGDINKDEFEQLKKDLKEL